MKAFCTLFTALFLLVGIADHAEAKRFGSGGGFGKQSAPAQQRQAAPAQKQENTQQTTQQNNAAPAQQAAGKSGLMGGMLGGLLAGGIFAYLLGSGAFEGIQFMDILLIVLVIGVIFFVLKKRAAPAKTAYAGQAPQQRQTFDMGNIGGGQASNATMSAAVHTAPSIDLPAGFDQAAFVQGSLEHYRTVQNAWNQGDLSLIADYVKPALYAELANQRQAMTIAPATEIFDLDAEIVAAGRNGNYAEISLLFKGRVRDLVEGSEDGIFDVWHLERDLSKENSPWLIAGIEAE